MAMAQFPRGVVAEVVTVRVEEPEPVIDAGARVAVAPHDVLALRATVPLKPASGETETV
jgi:hypothetical protein